MIDKGKFEYWLNEEANRKRNTSILADDIYKQIVEFLKTGETKNRNIKKRVDRKDYEIIDFPAIELYDVLCVPVKSKVKTILHNGNIHVTLFTIFAVK